MDELDYEIPNHNLRDEEIQKIFQTSKSIAVVGLSRDHDKDSHRVASYLQEWGYQIIPVNPKAKKILNEKTYEKLEDIPEKVDVVNIFQKFEYLSDIVDSAIAIGAKVVWMQERLVDNVAAERAREAGLTVVMDKCMMSAHKKYEIDTSV